MSTSSAIAKEYITRRELAEMISMSVPWLKKQERNGTGCPRIQCGRSVRYEIEAVRRWMAARVETASATPVA